MGDKPASHEGTVSISRVGAKPASFGLRKKEPATLAVLRGGAKQMDIDQVRTRRCPLLDERSATAMGALVDFLR